MSSGMHWRLFCAAALCASLALSCSGSPSDDSGQKETGQWIEAGVALESASLDVCDPGDVMALAAITNTPMDEDLPLNTLSVTGYSVSYSTTSGAPGIGSASYSASAELPISDMSVYVLDDARRAGLESALAEAAAPAYAVYTASYEFTGEDNYGSEFSAEASVTFTAGRDAACTLSVSPSEFSMSAVENPDSDASDDVTFYVSGGTRPYAVYSSDSGVIPGPGPLGGGVSSFTIDPDAPDADTEVTLTVLDSAGANAQAVVTVDAAEAGDDDPSAAQLSVSPSEITLTGIDNPDSDASDDVTFYVSGGTPPYSVYSSDSGVIPGPGPLEGGVSSFTRDPDAPAADTEVTLTVLDSSGQAATANATVTPPASTALAISALAISPSEISVACLTNPDSDASDDLTFHVSGGAAPYTIYSDNTGVIGVSGLTLEEAGSFTVDPNPESADPTEVTLTVVDSLGAAATSTVTVSRSY